MECQKRIANDEMPWLFLAKLLKKMPMQLPVGYLIGECMATAATSKDGLDFWMFVARQKGGFWESAPSPIARGRVTELVANMLSRLLHVPTLSLPDWFVSGGCPKLISECPVHFYNKNLIESMDGEGTWDYLQYSDGIVERVSTGEVFEGRPELLIGKCLGIPYPADYVTHYDAVLAER